MKTILAALLAAALLWSGNAQADSTSTDFEGWLQLQSFISLDDEKKYQLYLETQPRVGNDWSRAATVQNRAGLNYNWTKSFSSLLGYAWTPSFYNAEYHRTYIDEQRIFQQVLYRHDLLGVKWAHRVRQEQRFIVGNGNISNRTRYQLRGSYGLSEDGNFGLTGYDEFMTNLNGVDPAPYGGYDRNRIFFGPYLVVHGHRYEVGYLGEHLKRFGSDERWANVIVFSATFNF